MKVTIVPPRLGGFFETRTANPTHAKAWTPLELVAAIGDIAGHLRLAKASINSYAAPLASDEARDAALVQALRHLDLMMLSAGELITELQTIQQERNQTP